MLSIKTRIELKNSSVLKVKLIKSSSREMISALKSKQMIDAIFYLLLILKLYLYVSSVEDNLYPKVGL